MKNRIRVIITLIITLIIIILFNNKVEAKSYYIENMKIDAKILDNGDVNVEHIFEYSFNGQYNGVYLTIPINYINKEEIKSEIDDKLYNPSNIEIKQVSIENDKVDSTLFKKVNDAKVGMDGVYTEEINNSMYKLKVFSPSQNENKIFKVNYIMKDLCVKHNDCAELYYNFIGGEGDCLVKKLTINLFLPNNTGELKAWGHGPDNGITEIVDATHVKLTVSNVEKGKYVAARIVFDKYNIENSNKISNIDAYDSILEDEKKIAQISDEKTNYTKNIALFSLILLLYWFVLLLIYEIDKKIPIRDINEEELFDKYNPMLAGCLQGSRDILARDIIAVILNLIDKKCIELEVIGNVVGKDNYSYFIKKVPEKEKEMDEIEIFIYDWIFGNYKIDHTKLKNKSNELDKNNIIYGNKDKIELNYALKKLTEDEHTGEKFKLLNKKVQRKLSKQGANKIKVPIVLKIINTVIFILSVFLVIKHIDTIGILGLTNNTNVIGIIKIIAFLSILTLPVTALIIYIPIYIIITIRHKVSKLLQKVTGQKIVNTTISIILIFAVLIIITLISTKNAPANRYLLADEVLICISLIIMLTDNLMMKNAVNKIEDFSRLNLLKNKIEYYSLIDERDIEQIYLWEKYLAYAVSFGVAKKIIKRISPMHLDDDLMELINSSEFNKIISSNYYIFYTNSSLDRKFLKTYKETTYKMLENMRIRK